MSAAGMSAAGMRPRPPRLVLFDLDGTLADTAPDLTATVNRMREVRGLAPLPYPELRPLASHGARGLIGRALGVGPDDPRFAEMREEFFVTYERALCVHSRLFDGMPEVLAHIEASGRWGIVTNKMARFTDPLVAQLGLATRAACVVSGDTTPHPKPHPAPVLHALSLCGEVAADAIYVGDDLRDVQAGAAAGLRTVAVRYGYLGDGLPIEQWGADDVVDTAEELLGLLGG